MPPVVDRIYTYPSFPQLCVRQRRPGKKYESHCRLRIYQYGGKTIAVAGDCMENTGASACDAAPHLALMICREYGIDPAHLIYIVHDPDEEQFSWLQLAPPKTQEQFFTVLEERPLPPFARLELIGEEIE